MKSALLIAAISTMAVFAGPTASAAAPVDTGPALAVTQAQLDSAITCSGPLAGLSRDPVLLTPAFSSAAGSYGFSYQRQLPAIGITTCAIDTPKGGYGDLQVYAEYVVGAVRMMNTQSGRKVALMGHQHGALIELWALTFWPDLAGKVSELVSLATPYQGTVLGNGLCGTRLCAPATWQISKGSNFLTALNTRLARTGLPASIGFTSIATAFDEVIIPQPQVSVLPGASNILLQNVCPLRVVEHFSILADNLAYELVLDALNNPGPASPNRISSSVCFGPQFLPGVTSVQGGAKVAESITATALGAVYGVPANASIAEPPVRSYAK